MTAELREIAAHIGVDPSCIVDWPGPGEVLRHAHEPMPAEEAIRLARQQTEQRISRLAYDPQAVAARERRIARASGKLAEFPRPA